MTTDLANLIPSDIIGSKTIIAINNSFLPSSIGFMVLPNVNRFSEMPDSTRWHIGIAGKSSKYSTGPELQYKTSTASIAGASISITYRAGTPGEQSLIDQYGSIVRVPAYLLKNLIPDLRINDTVVASGVGSGLGKDLDMTLVVFSPWGIADNIKKHETIGATTVISLDLGFIAVEEVKQKAQKWEAQANMPVIDEAGYVSSALNFVGAYYFSQLDINNAISGRTLKVAGTREPSAVIVGESFDVGFLATDIPYRAELSGMFTDIARDVIISKSREGDANKTLAYNIAAGYTGSLWEHKVWESIWGRTQAIAMSAVKVMNIAMLTGQKFVTVTKSNMAATLPLLNIPQADKDAVERYAQAGRDVTLPMNLVAYNGSLYVGYIAIDPATGAGAFMINTALAGSKYVKCLKQAIAFADVIPFLPISVSLVLEYLAGIVNLLNAGKHYNEHGDLLRYLQNISLSLLMMLIGMLLAWVLFELMAISALVFALVTIFVMFLEYCMWLIGDRIGSDPPYSSLKSPPPVSLDECAWIRQ